MIVIQAIIIGLALYASQTVADICTGRSNGDQIPNPSDCGSFYVCNYGESKLFKCVNGLLYDPEKHVCNWAYMVKCGQLGSQEPSPNSPTVPTYSTSSYPEYTTTTTQYPTYTGPIIDEFYPGIVEPIPNVFHCTNPEFYFAPHPRNCEKYFICENYRLHHHQCGEGIYWDYVFNQCDYPGKTFCFSGGITTTTTATTTTTTTTTTGTTTADLQPVIDIKCPGGTAFIAHPDDCHKYYICIGDIPIATSCPEKMAWDKDLSQCNEEAWLECFG